MRRRVSRPAKVTSFLRRLGLAAPPPFVGRQGEFAKIGQALREFRLLVIHGAVGCGKTRLARELAMRGDVTGNATATYVRCHPGDRAVAVCARAERRMNALPGSLAEVLEHDSRLLIIDDAHHLPEADTVRLLGELAAERGQGRVLVLTREPLPLRRDQVRQEIDLGGLDEAAARELWNHHEETYGPTAATACDKALARTRGMPLALRREYARAAFGKDAWSVDALPARVRRSLEAVAVIRIPAAPAAVAALVPGDDPEPEASLIELVSRQLIDPLEDGRFAIHDVVRDEVLGVIDADGRVALEKAAAGLVSTIGRGRGDARRMAWDAGDDGALGMLDPVDRMREAVLHLIAAGELDAAAQRLIEDREVALHRGGGGEVLALIELLENRGASSSHKALAGLRAAIAARHNRVAEALEVGLQVADEADSCFGPIELAEMHFRSGDVAGATQRLERLCESEDANQRCAAAAELAEIELHRGLGVRAEALAAGAFERDRSAIDEDTRARLHVALAAIEQHFGRVTAARAALSRAASSGRLGVDLTALIECRRAACLAREGRVSEAEAAISDAKRAAREIDAVAIADEIRRHEALVSALRGDLLSSSDVLTRLVAARRQRGDEIGALQAEIDLAGVLAVRGELAAASELTSACRASANRRQLAGLEARAALVAVRIELAELRLRAAHDELQRLLDCEAADAETRVEAVSLVRLVAAWETTSGATRTTTRRAEPAADEARDEIVAARERAELALAVGDCGEALDAANLVAVRAERAGRKADLAEALAMVARQQLARGERAGAAAAASRAARVALSCGLSRARIGALLVLAALAREDEDIPAAFTYARDASKLATEAGLPLERLVAAEAIDAIAGAEGSSSGEAVDVRNAAAATMSQPALDAAARVLADLGLTAVRPYRVVVASGQVSCVADAKPDHLRMLDRDLAVDGVREVVYRGGRQTADLRRRSLLKRLLYLFAGQPGRVFSKEEIVETVWDVEYHPLRHDAALFTNIMRIRRLLGKDGADLIRVSEDGYRFVPPKDFLFVESVSES